ncbi:MAG: AraC family transcriptional regulator [Bacteroidales bacterium]
MKSLILLGALATLTLLVLLAAKRNKTRSDRFLSFLLLVYLGSIGGNYLELYNADHGFPLPFFLNLSWVFLLLHGPTLWLYVRSFALHRKPLQWFHLVHFLPFLAFLAYQLATFQTLPADERIQMVRDEVFKTTDFYRVSVLAIALSTLSYNLWALKRIREHQWQLKRHFSRIDDKDLRWLEILTIANLCIFGINVSLFNLDLIFGIAPYRTLVLVAFSLASVYTFLLGYFGLRQGQVFLSGEGSGDESGQESARRSGRKMPDSDPALPENEFISRILARMEEDRPYLDPEITLTKLADQLHVKSHTLSEALNAGVRQSFFDFINRYRIEEFKRRFLAEDQARYSIMGVASTCGFNSKAAFYRAFQKYEGTTPTQFLSRREGRRDTGSGR